MKLIDGLCAVDHLCCGPAVVTTQEYYAPRRVPAGVSQSRLVQFDGVRLPAVSVLRQLQAGVGGAGVDSATEDVPSESVPHAGAAGDGGKGERLVSRGDEDLSLVVGGDQDACNPESIVEINFI